MRHLSLVLLFICGLKSIEGCPCKEGQLKYQSSCYSFSDDTKTYDGAKSECAGLGGVLAIISCEDENTFLKGEAKKRQGSQYWLGATDLEEEGKWVWSNGNVAVFTDWGPKEPNNAGKGEGCLTLMRHWQYRWNDWFCDRPVNYICEFHQ